MGVYKVKHLLHLDDYFLDIRIPIKSSNYDEAFRTAEQSRIKVVLFNGYLEVLVSGNEIRIGSKEKEIYTVSVCTKVAGPTIATENIKAMAKEEKVDLFSDERYMITEDDIIKVDWDLYKLYKEIHTERPDYKGYSFSSLAFGVEIE